MSAVDGYYPPWIKDRARTTIFKSVFVEKLLKNFFKTGNKLFDINASDCRCICNLWIMHLPAAGSVPSILGTSSFLFTMESGLFSLDPSMSIRTKTIGLTAHHGPVDTCAKSQYAIMVAVATWDGGRLTAQDTKCSSI